MSSKKRKQGTVGLTAPLLEGKQSPESIADSIIKGYEQKRAESMWTVLKNKDQNSKDIEAFTFVMVELDRYKEQLRRGEPYEMFYLFYLLDMQFSHMTGTGKILHQWLCNEVNGCLPYVPSKQEVVDLFRFVGQLASSEYPEKTKDGRAFSFHQVSKWITLKQKEWEEDWGPCPEDDDFAHDAFRKHIETSLKPLHREASEKKSPLGYFIKMLCCRDHEGIFRCSQGRWEGWARQVEGNPRITLHWASIGIAIHHCTGRGSMKPSKLREDALNSMVVIMSTVTLPSFLWNMSLYKGLLVAQTQQAQNLTTKVTAGVMTAGIAGGQFLANYMLHHYLAEGAGQS